MQSRCLLFFLAVLFLSCNVNRTTILPSISGKSGEVIVVMTEEVKKTIVKNILDTLFLRDYEVLNQIEPIFTPTYIPPDAFTYIFQTHRNILIAKLEPSDSVAIKVYRNRWASPQLVLLATAPTIEELATLLKQNAAQIEQQYLHADLNRYVENLMKYEEKTLRKTVSENFDGLSVYFPSSYALKTTRPNFLWATLETPLTTQALLIYSYAWKSPQLPTKKEAVTERNIMLQINLPGTLSGSYMQTETVIPPLYTIISRNNPSCAELRGLWTVHGDFMGGPFISRLYLVPEKQKVYVVEGFVYAPNKNKRHMMREIEAILSQVQYQHF